MLSETDQTEQSLLQRKPLPQKKPRRTARSKPPSKAGIRRVPMREFSRSLPMSLLRAREAVMRHFRPSLRDHGLTEQQWRILRALASIYAAASYRFPQRV